MTDRNEALEALLSKVEAGDANHGDFATGFINNDPEDDGCVNRAIQSHHAYHGSLDSAKALHEDVLSYGWGLETFGIEGEVVLKRNKPVDRHYGFSDGSPARAWLIAILKALIAQEDDA